MITVRLRPQSRAIMHGFRDFVAALPETLNVYIIDRRSRTSLVHVAVPTPEALQDFVLDSLTKRKEVADVRTAVVFEHVRNHGGASRAESADAWLTVDMLKSRDPERRHGGAAEVVAPLARQGRLGAADLGDARRAGRSATR